MPDYIERGKAIAMRFGDGIEEDGVIYVPWKDVTAHLKKLPAADVRGNVRGVWKKVSDKYPKYCCTVCNHLYNNSEYKFCPNCGAQMKGETNVKIRQHKGY